MERPASRFPFLRRLEGADTLLFLYVVTIFRQYWAWAPLPNAVAWLLAAICGAAVSRLYVVTRDDGRTRTGLPFWLVVILPLSFAYLLRVAFPDVSFDVLNYRLFHGIRGLTGFLYRPGDFFPTPAPYNTAPDMVMGITRLALGYRLGTIVNLFALLWSARIIDRLLSSHIASPWARAAAVLVVFAAEHLFFEINTYMIDLLAVPLLLEAARLGLSEIAPQKWVNLMTRVAFLLGLSVAFKLINVVAALPIVALCGWRFFSEQSAQDARRNVGRTALFSCLAFLLPVLPFSIYLQQQMGSPVFPILNGVLKSPYWPPNSGWDNRWGTSGFWQVLLWPVSSFFRPDRLSELLVYSGRLSLGFVAAWLAWIIAWRDPGLRRISFLTVAGLLLWSAGTGYIRYALFLELLAGVLLVMLAVDSLKNQKLIPVAALVLGSLGAQSILACCYTAQTEWSGRPTFFKYPGPWKREANYFLRDRSLRGFSPKIDRTRFAQVEVWIESSIKTASLEILLNDRARVIGLRSYESFDHPKSRLRFVEALDAAAAKRMFTLCFTEDLAESLRTVTARGLTAGAQTPIELPFYSPDYRLSLILIEVSGAPEAAAAMRKTL